jgi:sugar lactone lactonase YvrE
VVLRRPGFPVTLAFDAAGSLWIADDLEHSIFTFTAAQLAAPGPVIGRRVLGILNGLNNPTGLAFDGAGNLWIANVGGDNVVAFTPDQLETPQQRAPNVVLSSTNGSLTLPVGLAFDASGSLWVVGGVGGLAKFDPASLAANGAPEPSARLRLSGHTLFWGVAFWPRPVGLPIN